MPARRPYLLAALLLGCGRSAPAPDADPELARAAAFVETFYRWYLPAAGTGAGVQTALGDSAALFAADLVRALEADREAQAGNQDEIVGLDGDPFLDAQDFCERYDVGAVRRDGPVVLVDVHARCADQDDTTPRIVARVERTGRGWTFLNFHYPQRSSDLLKDLDELRRERERPR